MCLSLVLWSCWQTTLSKERERGRKRARNFTQNPLPPLCLLSLSLSPFTRLHASVTVSHVTATPISSVFAASRGPLGRADQLHNHIHVCFASSSLALRRTKASAPQCANSLDHTIQLNGLGLLHSEKHASEEKTKGRPQVLCRLCLLLPHPPSSVAHRPHSVPICRRTRLATAEKNRQHCTDSAASTTAVFISPLSPLLLPLSPSLSPPRPSLPASHSQRLMPQWPSPRCSC